MAGGALQPGDVFLDYRIRAVIDAGGMGEVYEAVEDYSDDVVAIKCMSPRHMRRADFARRFRQECKFYPKLKHPNIVRMRKAGVSPDEVAYIVMDYLEGRTLRKLLNKAYRLDFLSAMHVMLQVADAMTFVHSKGIWHRDLKPENIMVGSKGDAKGHVWLLDFGIAKFADGGMNTDDLPDVGTVRYISPEQVRLLYTSGKKAERAKPDGRTDIYAFGAIFYEVLTGKHLFLDDSVPASAEETLTGHLVAAPEPVHEIVPDCPEYVWPVVERCIAIDLEERYPRFDEVARDLRALLRDTVPAGHVLARRLAQERMKAERRAAFAGVEMGDESAPVEGEAGAGGAGAGKGAVGEEETEEARGPGDGESGSGSEGGEMARVSESGSEQEKRARRVVHGETAPLERFVAPESPLPFAPASRGAARVPRGRGVGYTEPLPSTLPPLPVRAGGSAARRDATAVLGGSWAERTGQRGGPPPMPVTGGQVAVPPPMPVTGGQVAVPPPMPPMPVRGEQYAAPPAMPVRGEPYAAPPPMPVRGEPYAAPPPMPVMETQRAVALPPVAERGLQRAVTPPPLPVMGGQYAAPPPAMAPMPVTGGQYAAPPVMPVTGEQRAVPPPMPVMDMQRAALRPLPQARAQHDAATPPLAQFAAQSATPPLPMAPLAGPYAAAPPIAEAPTAPSAVAPAGGPASGSLQRETPRTPAAMIAHPRRAMRPYLLAPLIALGLTAAGLGIALGIRAMGDAAPEPEASVTPAESATAGAVSASAAVAPAPPEETISAAPAPEATASAAETSAAEAAAEVEAAAEAEASSTQQPAVPARPASAATDDAEEVYGEESSSEEIYPMPRRQKPSFLRVLSEEKKKAAPAKRGNAKPTRSCPAFGCEPEF
ncbi:protein kinase [Sorangium cellulosum]|uniref:Protein kinase n=1 Tax=Sorangium cellulosum TaxID=56 RepID=A0A4P2PUI2_SORCE|nr:serine/threonine-protein kinase [Sorangium cellulosum]AUX20258.1 protein kinase [Sorangium cellulosum]